MKYTITLIWDITFKLKWKEFLSERYEILIISRALLQNLFMKGVDHWDDNNLSSPGFLKQSSVSH